MIADCKFSVFVYLFDIAHLIISISQTFHNGIPASLFTPEPNRRRHIRCVVAHFFIMNIFFKSLCITEQYFSPVFPRCLTWLKNSLFCFSLLLLLFEFFASKNASDFFLESVLLTIDYTFTTIPL